MAAGKECGILCLNDSTFSWLVPSGQQKITWGTEKGDWLITVTDANGKSTYLDSDGQPAFSFPGWAQWRRVENKEIDGYDYVSQSVNNGYHLYWAAKNSSDKYFTHIVNEKGIPVVNVGTTKIVKMITVDLMMVSRNGRIGLVDVKTGKVLAPCGAPLWLGRRRDALLHVQQHSNGKDLFRLPEWQALGQGYLQLVANRGAHQQADHCEDTRGERARR